MKATNSFWGLVGAVLSTGAGEFLNMDFEQANTNNMLEIGFRSYLGSTADLLPGWRLGAGGAYSGNIGLNLFPIGGGVAYTLITPDNPNGWPMPVLGSYAVCFQPASFSYHLSQTGEIPADALSIEFGVYAAPWKLEANGQPIPLTYEPYSGAMTFHIARGDISAFAGTSTELVFTTIGSPWNDFTVIDSIAFSSRAIPEPSTWALLGLGGLGLWWMRRRSG